MMAGDVFTILNFSLSFGGLSNMDLISCDKCGKEFPKSKLKKCQTCGQILCFKCRLFHKCTPKDKEVVLPEYHTITPDIDSSLPIKSQSAIPITFNLKQGFYAQRHDFENLQVLFERGFKIPSGLKVFFIQNGILNTTLRPGNYKSLSSVNDSLGKNKLILDDYTSIIITDTTFISLPFAISEISVKTKDGVGVDITGNLSLSINDAVRFGSHYLRDVSETSVDTISTDVLSVLKKCTVDTCARYDGQEFENYSYLHSIVKDSLKSYLNDCLNVYGLNIITFAVDFKFNLPNVSAHDFESESSDFSLESFSVSHNSFINEEDVIISQLDKTIPSFEPHLPTKSQSVEPITFELKQGLYAQKYDFENLQALFESGFKVPASLNVFFIQNGVLKSTLKTTFKPRSYKSLSSFNNSLNKNNQILDNYTSILVVGTTFIYLPFVISENIKTKDDIEVTVSGNLSFSIKDGVRFSSHYLNDVSETTVEIIFTDILSIFGKCAKDIFRRYEEYEFERYSYLDSIVKDSLKNYLNDLLNSHGLVATFSAEFKFGLPNIRPHDFESELADFNHESNLESSIAEKPNVTPNTERGKEEFESDEYKRALASEYARKSHLSKERFYFEQSYPSGNFQSEMERMVLHNPMDLPIQPALMSLMNSENSSVREIVSKELVRRAILVTPDDIISISGKNSLIAGNILASKCNFESLTQLKNFMDEDCTAFESMMSELYGEYSGEMICVLNDAFSEMCGMN